MPVSKPVCVARANSRMGLRMSESQSEAKGLSRVQRIFRSLHYRNFKLFFMGHGVSLIGTWMQMIAAGWLAYDLTAGQPEGVRAIWLGVVAFASRIPTFLLAPLAGAMFLAMRESVRGLALWIAVAPAIMGLGLIGLGLSRWVWVSVLVMPVIGFGLLVQMASSNTLIQTLVEDHMRGRVMSLYSMAFMGMVPLGGLLAGLMARLIGAPATVMVNGLWCVVGSILFFNQLQAFRRQIHPVYVKKGIMTAEFTGLPNAP